MKLSFVRHLFNIFLPGMLSQYSSQLTTLEHDGIYRSLLIIRNTIYASEHVFDVCIGGDSDLKLNANSAIFQLYHDENKLIFNEMMMRSALY